MDGLVGFIGLMLGVLLVAIVVLLIVVTVRKRKKAWLQDGHRRV